MSEREQPGQAINQLIAAIAALEAQRATLGDAAVDFGLAIGDWQSMKHG